MVGTVNWTTEGRRTNRPADATPAEAVRRLRPVGELGGLGGLRALSGRPTVAAVAGCLVDVAVAGDPGDVICWVEQSPEVSLAREDPNPAYDHEERLWHLRFRAEKPGTVVLHLVRDRPGKRPVRTSMTLRVRPEHP